MKAITLPLIITGALIGTLFTEITQKTKVLTDNSRVTYNVNEKNKLEGAYFVENTNRDIWIRGAYKDNQRIGNWYTFNSDKTVALRYNYDLKKILFLDTIALKKAEITITDPNANGNGSVVLPICSIDQYLSVLKAAAKSIFPKEQIIYNKEIPIEIIATVKSSDDVIYTISYKINNKMYAFDIKNKDIDFDIEWIPSSYNGKNLEAEFSVKSSLLFLDNGSEKQRFKWNY
jgi:hypothetical protein